MRAIWWLALLSVVVWVVATRFSQLSDTARGADPRLLALAFVLLVGQVLPTSGMWSSALRRLGQPEATLDRTLAATVRSLPARYVPGSIWFAASRGALLHRELGVARSRLATTAALELALTLATAIALGAGLLLAAGSSSLPSAALVAAGALALIAASPPVVNRLLAAVARRRGTTPDALAWSDVGAVAGWAALHWTWSTTTFVVYLLAFPALSDAPLPVLAGSYLVSWAVAFLAVLAPQGAGVFEVTLAALLGASAATGAAPDLPSAALLLGGHRALVVLRDVLLSSAGWWHHRRRPASSPAGGTSAGR